jgi:hypothetical protein
LPAVPIALGAAFQVRALRLMPHLSSCLILSTLGHRSGEFVKNCPRWALEPHWLRTVGSPRLTVASLGWFGGKHT